MEKNLQEVMEEISSIRLKGTALGWSAQQTFEAYKNLLPLEVTLVEFPSKNLNCAGYALDLNHTTSNLTGYLERDFNQVDSSKNANIYVLYFHEDWIHAGKIVDDKTAVSKGGWFEPVFKHPILFYPRSWDEIKYFRRKGV
ncbi:MAG: hypothetical protein Q8N63_04345 [Nanoarchaeota archaeon]|nr:hypothetical protein [Nanoarchaeota archaeon]